MRAALSGAMALLAVTALNAVPPARLSYCATKADKTAIAAHSKANSFAPHPGAHSRVYGAPIQSRILKSHTKKKPQLTSSPLPDSTSANTPSGG
jgi:hypothetical protein